MAKKRKRSKKKIKNPKNLFKGILIFAIVSFFTWMFMTGLLEILNINTSSWVKAIIGLVGLFIAGYIGWKKF